MTWKPRKGQRRHQWIYWVWGNVRWANCWPLWETNPIVKCDLYHQRHHGKVHLQLVECFIWATAFRQAQVDYWGDWSDLMNSLNHSSLPERYHTAKLRFPTTLIEIIALKLWHHIPQQVAQF